MVESEDNKMLQRQPLQRQRTRQPQVAQLKLGEILQQIHDATLAADGIELLKALATVLGHQPLVDLRTVKDARKSLGLYGLRPRKRSNNTRTEPLRSIDFGSHLDFVPFARALAKSCPGAACVRAKHVYCLRLSRAKASIVWALVNCGQRRGLWRHTPHARSRGRLHSSKLVMEVWVWGDRSAEPLRVLLALLRKP